MKVWVVVQETQNEHGYVDTTLIDAFTEERLAKRAIEGAQDTDVEEGERVEGKNAAPGEWTVSYHVTEVELYRAPRNSAESQLYIDTGELPVERGRGRGGAVSALGFIEPLVTCPTCAGSEYVSKDGQVVDCPNPKCSQGFLLQ